MAPSNLQGKPSAAVGARVLAALLGGYAFCRGLIAMAVAGLRQAWPSVMPNI